MAEKKPSCQKKQKNRKPHHHCVKNPNAVKDVRMNLRKSKFKTKHSSDSQNQYTEPLPDAQPQTSWASYDNLSDDEEEPKDFESLVNAPLSTGYFQFKSEKDWDFDISKSSDLFTFDLKHLNAAVSCIPFNKIIGLDDSYFNKDQLTYFQSVADTARKDYENIFSGVSTSKTEQPNESNGQELANVFNLKVTMNPEKTDTQESEGAGENSSKIENNEDDLDFLLTLKEPVMSTPITVPLFSSSANITEPRAKSTSVPTKSVDLDKWLDSVLDI